MKKIIFFAALALSLLFVSAVYAAEGSLTIVGGPYEGKYYKTDFSIYKIAGSDFTFTENFAGLGWDLSAIDTAEETEAAADVVSSYINENNIAYMYEKSGESQVTFSNLEEGYYFLEFNKTENADMMSFIIGIPYYDSDSGEYYYDVSITAKITAGSTGGGGGTGSDETTTESTTETGNDGGGGSDDGDDNSKPSGGGGGSSYIIGGEDPNPTPDHKTSDAISPSSSDEPDEPNEPDNPEEPEEEPSAEITTTLNLTENVPEPNRETEVDLPKTGGDKTVLLCNYFGGFFGIAGMIILFFNNLIVRKRKNKSC